MEELMLAALGVGLGFPCGSSEDETEDESDMRHFNPVSHETEEERETRERKQRRKAKAKRKAKR